MLIHETRRNRDDVRLHRGEHLPVVGVSLVELQLLLFRRQAVCIGIREPHYLRLRDLEPHGVLPMPVVSPASMPDHGDAKFSIAWEIRAGERQSGGGCSGDGEEKASIHHGGLPMITRRFPRPCQNSHSRPQRVH
jgi:hypothetical protein